MIYDCVIQLTFGLEYIHSKGFAHGNLCLKNIMRTSDGETTLFKLNNFAPKSSLRKLDDIRAKNWPFVIGRPKRIGGDKNTIEEKWDILMMKDIYNLGTTILELMIGRHDKKKFSLQINSIPLTWSEYAESQPLVQVLLECIQLDSTSSRDNKLSSIRQLLLNNYTQFFKKPYYKMQEPFEGKMIDVKNKRAVAGFMNNKLEEVNAHKLWEEALSVNNEHFDSLINFNLYLWQNALISDHVLLSLF